MYWPFFKVISLLIVRTPVSVVNSVAEPASVGIFVYTLLAAAAVGA